MGVGLAMATLGMLWFTRIGVHTGFVTHVLPSEIVVSLGLGLAFVPMSSTALVGVAEHDAGVASALVNTTQQIGGALGTALLNTIAASATASYLVAHGHGPVAAAAGAVHGYTTGFAYSAALVGLSVVVALALVRASRRDLPALEAVPA
jgi:hypothetical protein